MRILAILLPLLACAEINQSIKENLAGGAEPRPELVEPGQGWWCYVASSSTWSGCWRTVEKCNEERGSNSLESRRKGDGIFFGACQQMASASCVTYGKMTMQKDGSAKPEPVWDCMPDGGSCSNFTENLRKDSSNSHISRCFDVK